MSIRETGNEDKVEITRDSKQRWDEDTFDRLLRERRRDRK